MKKTVTCPTCGHETEVEACEKCDGAGFLWDPDKDWPSVFPAIKHCRDCHGTGIKGGFVFYRNQTKP